MLVSGSTFSPLAGVRMNIGPRVEPTSATQPTGPSLRDFAARVAELRNAHRGLVLGGRSYRIGGNPQDASVRSGSTLDLSTTPTAARTRSTEEVNAIPTSYSTHAPTFSGSSSSDPTLGGVYSGANGDTDLTFTVTSGGLIGVVPAEVEVRDRDDNLVDTVSLGFDGPGTTYTLSNGLEVSFSSGSLQLGDSFEVRVYASQGSAVRPDSPFDQSGDAGPEFEPGLAVGAGSFEVNGVSIAVLADDTLNAVLDRITNSAAGVTASFDVASETVVLTQDTLGPGEDIVLGNDTSGFLDATKLSAAITTPGTSDESMQVIDQVAVLSGIQSGTFLIDQTVFNVDVQQDSLADVFERINSSGLGVTASYDSASGRVTIEAQGSASLTLDDGSSGFFSALDLSLGTSEATGSATRTRFGNEGALRRGLSEFAKAFQEVLELSIDGYGKSTVSGFQAGLLASVSEAFETHRGVEGEDRLRSGLGVDFTNEGDAKGRIELDVRRLTQALKDEGEALSDFLFSESEVEEERGLITAIGERTEKALKDLQVLLQGDTAGLLLNLRA